MENLVKTEWGYVSTKSAWGYVLPVFVVLAVIAYPAWVIDVCVIKPLHAVVRRF